MDETVITVANQTQVPARLRRRFGAQAGDTVVWEETADGARVRFRRTHRLGDLIGLAPGSARGDSVRAKRGAQRGGR